MNVDDIEKKFFSNANYNQVVNALVKRGGADVTSDRQIAKAADIVKHYMNEVWEFDGPMPLMTLNGKVLNASTQPFLNSLRPKGSGLGASSVVREEKRPAGAASVEERYSQIQQERTTVKDKRPPIPDFAISLESDKEGPTPAELFDMEMKRRETEAAYVQSQIAAKELASASASTQVPLQASKPPQPQSPLAQAKAQSEDPRKKNTTEEEELDTMMNMDSIYRSIVAGQPRDPIANPTIAQPNVIGSRPIQQQDILIKQDPVVSYKELEENLFLYSADRDWVNETKQSRYNFTVNFDPANNRHGFNPNLSVVKRFKNIQRIELVKAVLPIEGLETFFEIDDPQPDGASTTITERRVSIYQFPYVNLRIPELDINNYGTNDNLNNSFGILQYDAEWNTDNFIGSAGNMGFTTYIPKHLKCQKIYQPTPLATLNRLSVELQRPDGSILSYIPDTIDLASIVFSKSGGANSSRYFSNSIVDTASNSYYIILRTSTFFSRWAFNIGDRIQLGGLNLDFVTVPQAKNELLNFLEDPTGHTIVGVGYDTDGIKDGYNRFGYANWIAIRAPINDPSTGQTTVRTIGDAEYGTLVTDLESNTLEKGRVLNQSHQIQLVFRVITREMEANSRIRPDNL